MCLHEAANQSNRNDAEIQVSNYRFRIKHFSHVRGLFLKFVNKPSRMQKSEKSLKLTNQQKKTTLAAKKELLRQSKIVLTRNEADFWPCLDENQRVKFIELLQRWDSDQFELNCIFQLSNYIRLVAHAATKRSSTSASNPPSDTSTKAPHIASSSPMNLVRDFVQNIWSHRLSTKRQTPKSSSSSDWKKSRGTCTMCLQSLSQLTIHSHRPTLTLSTIISTFTPNGWEITVEFRGKLMFQQMSRERWGRRSRRNSPKNRQQLRSLRSRKRWNLHIEQRHPMSRVWVSLTAPTLSRSPKTTALLRRHRRRSIDPSKSNESFPILIESEN